MTDPELRAADGRVPGRRGRATRTRLLECTAEMLSTTSLRDLKVIDIAREASTSPATFYQYFPDVESAILVLAEDMATSTNALSEHVRVANWKGKGGYEAALDLTDRFIEFWEEYRPVLRVVDLATGEGDRRFGHIRSRMLNSVTVALSEAIKVAQPKPKGDEPLDPMATAGVLVAMLANVASHRYGFEFWGIRTDEARRSMAHLIYWSVTGQRPPV
ncbi:MAG: TetR family transcriptional regulator [Actinomycetia bacterium]|nr:TetR family transcriptional regulator [Actinomycetes bacterium]